MQVDECCEKINSLTLDPNLEKEILDLKNKVLDLNNKVLHLTNLLGRVITVLEANSETLRMLNLFSIQLVKKITT